MIYEEKINQLSYLIYYPDDFDEKKKTPLLIHIHGAGACGKDLRLVKKTGPIFEVLQGKKLPFVIIAPQCHAETWFEIYNQLLEFIDYTSNLYFIDKSRVYLSGVSMGGYTAWTTAMIKPELFAALVVVCGGGMYWNADKLREIPIWAFHGALDNTVYVTESINMVRAVNNAGGNAKLTIYPDVAHNSWEKAFATDELYTWLLSHKRG